MSKSSDRTASVIVRVIDRTIILFVMIMIFNTSNDVAELQETIDNLKPVDDCAWLYPDAKRGAVIYNRFDSEITIQCKRGKK